MSPETIWGFRADLGEFLEEWWFHIAISCYLFGCVPALSSQTLAFLILRNLPSHPGGLLWVWKMLKLDFHQRSGMASLVHIWQETDLCFRPLRWRKWMFVCSRPSFTFTFCRAYSTGERILECKPKLQNYFMLLGDRGWSELRGHDWGWKRWQFWLLPQVIPLQPNLDQQYVDV